MSRCRTALLSLALCVTVFATAPACFAEDSGAPSKETAVQSGADATVEQSDTKTDSDSATDDTADSEKVAVEAVIPEVKATSVSTRKAADSVLLDNTPSPERMTPTVRAIRRVQSSVVNIHTEKTSIERTALFPNGKGRKVNGMGTGVVIDSRGYLVTNHHVVAEVDSLRCVLRDGATYSGTVVATDSKHDLAIVKINPSRPLPVAPFGTSSDLMLGETVIAIGNAYGYEHSVTCGIVSHLSRDVEVNEHQSYEDLIQTDASINPGNSGGPLLNLDGEIVGINVAIRAGAQRIGFAIPVDSARQRVAAMFNTRRFGGYDLGLVTRDRKAGRRRELTVERVTGGYPASTAGLKPGDIIMEIDSASIADRADLERTLIGIDDDTVDVVVRRGGERLALSLPVGDSRLASKPRTVQKPTKTVSALPTPSDDVAWQRLGCRLTPVPVDRKAGDGTRYRGGMKITSVRPGTIAHKNGIRPGDILVGLHEWETINHENVSYVLDHPELKNFDPLKFFILRNGETLYGHFRFPSK